MRHARLTRFVDRIVAISMVCLVCSILCVAAVVEAARLRLSRAPAGNRDAERSKPISRGDLVQVSALRPGNGEGELDPARMARLSGVDELTIDDYALWSERAR